MQSSGHVGNICGTLDILFEVDSIISQTMECSCEIIQCQFESLSFSPNHKKPIPLTCNRKTYLVFVYIVNRLCCIVAGHCHRLHEPHTSQLFQQSIALEKLYMYLGCQFYAHGVDWNASPHHLVSAC